MCRYIRIDIHLRDTSTTRAEKIILKMVGNTEWIELAREFAVRRINHNVKIWKKNKEGKERYLDVPFDLLKETVEMRENVLPSSPLIYANDRQWSVSKTEYDGKYYFSFTHFSEDGGRDALRCFNLSEYQMERIVEWISDPGYRLVEKRGEERKIGQKFCRPRTLEMEEPPAKRILLVKHETYQYVEKLFGITRYESAVFLTKDLCQREMIKHEAHSTGDVEMITSTKDILSPLSLAKKIYHFVLSKKYFDEVRAMCNGCKEEQLNQLGHICVTAEDIIPEAVRKAHEAITFGELKEACRFMMLQYDLGEDYITDHHVLCILGEFPPNDKSVFDSSRFEYEFSLL